MDELMHYGTPRHSGRYPWGSGENPYQRNASFLANVYDLRKKGLSETEIAKGWNMNTSELRTKISMANHEKRAYEVAQANRLYNKGLGYTAIAKRMGKNESSIRKLLDTTISTRKKQADINANILKDAVSQKTYVDVGAGVEQLLGIRRHQLDMAVNRLKQEGYAVHNVQVEQLGTGKETTVRVLTAPGTEWKDVAKNKHNIKLPVQAYSEDGGLTARKIEPPKSISSKRVAIRYTEDGGSEKDGVIELRRGVADLDLHNAKYAQVRIAVDGTHYLKGMAMYSDDIPDGVDIVFNTNKHKGTPMIDGDRGVLKPMKNDPDNPFGATIKDDDRLTRAQRHYIDKDGKEQLSALNIVNEEGDWNNWRRTLASQMLSKQSPQLAKQQLDISYRTAKDEYDEIMSLTNPTLRNFLLDKFASQCDSDATHLNAAALPRQSTKVILPFPEMSEHEIYAPGYDNGERVALIRYPHGGIFEIPTLTVNNNNRKARSLIENATDAVGINHKVAEQLSGADFDGDSVLVIPIDRVNLRTSSPLKGLEGFNPSEMYPEYPGMHIMTDQEKGLEMGKVSNLITDMTIKGAPEEHIAAAVRHSMVVIDAKKHRLNYKQSEIDNNIPELKRIYQGGPNAGASTIISRSTSEKRPNQRALKRVNEMTPDELERYRKGENIYAETGRTYSKRVTDAEGNTVRWEQRLRKDKVPRMMQVDDAYELVSGDKASYQIESVYADYANSMKALANQSRSVARSGQDIEYDPAARKIYDAEYKSLLNKLNEARRNAPLERQAQLIADKAVQTKVFNNPEIRKDKEKLGRLKSQELDDARWKTGAKKNLVQITDREWAAISSGAIPKTFFKDILNNADLDSVRQLAMPKTFQGMSPGKVASAKAMLAKHYTQKEVADMLGVSTSTLLKAIE